MVGVRGRTASGVAAIGLFPLLLGWASEPETPAYGEGSRWENELVLREELRIGSILANEHETFGSVVDVTTTADGNVWIPDGMAGRIQVFDRSGAFVRTVGRRGSGPSEFQNLTAIETLPGGNEVAVFDPLNQRIHVFGLVGTLVRDVSFSTSASLMGKIAFLVDRSGFMILADPVMTRTGPGDFRWLVLDPEGEVTGRLTPPGPERDGYSNGISTVSLPRSKDVYISGRKDRFRFVAQSPNGEQVLFERPHEPVTYARDERREKQAWEDYHAARRGESPRRLPRTKPAWSLFWIDQDDRIWVRRHVEGFRSDSVAPPSSVPAEFYADQSSRNWSEPVVYDVHHPDGSFWGTLRFPDSAGGWTRRLTVVHATGDEVWAMRIGEFDEQYVVRYSIHEGPSD